ncbi:ubiquinone/menaquinone biosynthesis C-methylase UbiE [Anaerotaenia torta]|uniref:class I SAM-dependent DNA methyltransferase n=1 Tax=Anaerotaenia torta TaxID=433293 RepID=UPI003D1B88CA
MGYWLEEMGSFFDTRSGTYEEHMLTEIDGMEEAYHEIARHIPDGRNRKLVDLGCGTGLELEKIFLRNPDMIVTGIDLSSGMLGILQDKFKSKKLDLHQMSYFDFDYGDREYDAALSCMTLHHFSHCDKIQLYTRLCRGLAENGRYVECDYMVEEQTLEDYYYAENERIRREHGISEGFYHYDTPCTIDNQIKMLTQAGFSKVEKVFHKGTTVILVCSK